MRSHHPPSPHFVHHACRSILCPICLVAAQAHMRYNLTGMRAKLQSRAIVLLHLRHAIRSSDIDYTQSLTAVSGSCHRRSNAERVRVKCKFTRAAVAGRASSEP